MSTSRTLFTVEGPVAFLTFNRPEARNAMTWEMYQRLYDACEEVDADDSIRVLVLKGAGGKAFVAGTDIGQFTQFKGAGDGLRDEAGGDRGAGGIARGEKPRIARDRHQARHALSHEVEAAFARGRSGLAIA